MAEMVDWVLLFIGTISFVEIFLRLGILRRLLRLNNLLGKITKTIRSPKISDHWKEKVLVSYALSLFLQSLLIFATLLASCSVFIVFILLSKYFETEFTKLSTSPLGLSVCTLTALTYAKLKSKQTSKKQDDYSAGSKLLHNLVLGVPFVGEALFDLEKNLHGKKAREVENQFPVFIAGLARAGTTVLMRKIYETKRFHSLTYRDMPFILSPNIWNSLSLFNKKSSQTVERAHGDGLHVNYDSPEAFEDVFWKLAAAESYIKKDSLTPMTADGDIIGDYRKFISLVMKDHDGKRYLSKNNNNILRLPTITKAFPTATILIPFRHPRDQAYSLLSQHLRFCNLHKEDPFSKKYMGWLVHHEFGSDHRPFVFNNQTALPDNPTELEYWLHLWLNTYSFVSHNRQNNSILVCYESLCNKDGQAWTKLVKTLKLSGDESSLPLKPPSPKPEAEELYSLIPQTLRFEVEQLYESLKRKSLQ